MPLRKKRPGGPKLETSLPKSSELELRMTEIPSSERETPRPRASASKLQDVGMIERDESRSEIQSSNAKELFKFPEAVPQIKTSAEIEARIAAPSEVVPQMTSAEIEETRVATPLEVIPPVIASIGGEESRFVTLSEVLSPMTTSAGKEESKNAPPFVVESEPEQQWYAQPLHRTEIVEAEFQPEPTVPHVVERAAEPKIEDSTEQQLSAQLKDRDRKVRKLQEQLQKLQYESQKRAQIIKEQNRNLVDSRNQHRVTMAKIDRIETRCLELGYDNGYKSTQLEKHRQSQGFTRSEREKQLQIQVESQAEMIKELGVRVESQEENIQAAQEFAFELRKKSRHDAMDDGEIRVVLENEILRMPKDWAKKWAMDTTELEKSPGYQTAELQQELRKVTGFQGDALREYLKGLPPYIVLNALLSHYSAEYIFQQPFFSLNENIEGKSFSSGTTFGEKMMWLYNAFLKVGEAEAHTWRSQTLQLLSRTDIPDSGLSQAIGLARSFLSGPCGSLLKTNSDPAEEEELVDIFKVAGTMSLSLWKQRTALRVEGFKYFQQIHFSSDSPEMEIHRIHKLDDDDDERDGDKVGMVVQPGFFAFGNEDGEAYGHRKIWSKAVVLLEKNEDDWT